jgi:hypothetical protein
LGYYMWIIDRIHIQSSLVFLIVFSRRETGKNSPHPRPKSEGEGIRDISEGKFPPPSLEKKNTVKKNLKMKDPDKNEKLKYLFWSLIPSKLED